MTAQSERAKRTCGGQYLGNAWECSIESLCLESLLLAKELWSYREHGQRDVHSPIGTDLHELSSEKGGDGLEAGQSRLQWNRGTSSTVSVVFLSQSANCASIHAG
jgi:hypothetical protein